MSIKREKVKVYDMTCSSCESKIEKSLRKLPGINNAIASYSAQEVIIEYETELCTLKAIKESIQNAGYSVKDTKSYRLAGILIITAAIALIGNSTSSFDMNSKLNGASYLVLFVVGALTSIHCVGMCGGIMLSQTISSKNGSKLESIIPALLYNAGRVLSYTVIGGIVGAIGSALSLSLPAKAALQIFAAVFMVLMGLNMAGFNLFRKISIKLPWSACSIKKKTKTPFVVGLLNGLMPCGPLQTMQLYALGTGSAFKGALSMLIFSLGTIPLMLAFGALSGLLSKGYTKKILKLSGFLVIFLGLIMGSRGLALAGVAVPNISAFTQANTQDTASGANIGKATIENGVQVITMTADNRGYTPNAFYIQKNMPVKWVIKGDALNSCNNAIVVPSLNKQLTLKKGDNILEFTPRDKDINFSCWMGMIRGVIKVTDNLNTVDTSKTDTSIPAPSSGMSCCGGGTTSSTTSEPQKPSIYGSDLSLLPTDKLVKKASISGSIQKVPLKGIGFEFDPLIIVAAKNRETTLSIDLTTFDTPDGVFKIESAADGREISSFSGKKGIVNVRIDLSKGDGYVISKNNNALAVIETVEDLKNADLENIRAKYLRN